MNRIAPILLGLIAAVALASSMLFVVDQRQYAVVFALGELKEVITKPGLHFKLPPPFQNVQYFDKRILTIDTADVDRFITSEKLNVQIDTFVKWRIADPKKFFTSVGGSETIASDRLQRSLRDSLNNEIAKQTVNDVISGKRQELLDSVRSKMNEDAKQIGAEIVDVRLKRVDSLRKCPNVCSIGCSPSASGWPMSAGQPVPPSRRRFAQTPIGSATC